MKRCLGRSGTRMRCCGSRWKVRDQISETHDGVTISGSLGCLFGLGRVGWFGPCDRPRPLCLGCFEVGVVEEERASASRKSHLT